MDKIKIMKQLGGYMAAYQLKHSFKLFALNSNQSLAKEIAEILGCGLGKCSVTHFSDGEIQVHIEESVRGSEVFLVQSTSFPNNDHIMELLIMIDALKRASAKAINVVVPYYSYARQDRKARSREPITAKLIANLLETSGATRLLTMDLHAPQSQGFFDIPVDHLLGIPILSEYFAKKGLEDIVVVAPNNSSTITARKMAGFLRAPIAIIDKRGTDAVMEEIMVVGDIKGKNAILIDDLIDTGETMATAAQALMEKGAKNVYASCTHPVFSGTSVSRVDSSPIKELVVTNTIELPEEKLIDKLTVLSVAPLLAEAINRIHNKQAVSPLFE